MTPERKRKKKEAPRAKKRGGTFAKESLGRIKGGEYCGKEKKNGPRLKPSPQDEVGWR